MRSDDYADRGLERVLDAAETVILVCVIVFWAILYGPLWVIGRFGHRRG